MRYCIRKSLFAAKIMHDDYLEIEENSHGVGFTKCNFRCKFCRIDHGSKVPEYDQYHFAAEIMRLMQSGKNFKFSGGEQSLNPDLKQDLRIVKNLGGAIFLDTNGSNPQVIKEVIDEGLVDVLGVSLKGLTKEEAMNVTGVKNGRFCWENTFETIDYASKAENVRVIVTHVCYNKADLAELERFGELLSPFKDVYYKINNVFESPKNPDFKSLAPGYLAGLLREFMAKHPEWENRIILIDTFEGRSYYDKISFM